MIEIIIVLVLFLSLITYQVVAFNQIENDLKDSIVEWQGSLHRKLTMLDATKLLEEKIEEYAPVRILKALTIVLSVFGVLLTVFFTIILLLGSGNSFTLDLISIEVAPLLCGVAFGAFGAIENQAVLLLVIEERLIKIRNLALQNFSNSDFDEIIIEPSSHIESVRSGIKDASKDLTKIAKDFHKVTEDHMNSMLIARDAIERLYESCNGVAESLKAVNFQNQVSGLTEQIKNLNSAIGQSADSVAKQTKATADMFNNSVTSIEKTFDNAKNTFTSDSTEMKKSFVTAVDAMSNSNSEKFAQLNKNLVDRLVSLEKTLNNSVAGYQSQTTELITEISANLSKTNSNIESKFNSDNETVSALQRAVGMMLNSFNSMNASVDERINVAKEEISNAKEEAAKIVKDASDNTFERRHAEMLQSIDNRIIKLKKAMDDSSQTILNLARQIRKIS